MSEVRLFHDVVRDRHSVRSFLPDPVPDDVLRSVLEDAQFAPSNCNTQPWETHIVSGATRDALGKAMLAVDEAGRMTPDFSFSLDYPGVYGERAKAQGTAYYQALDVAGKPIAAVLSKSVSAEIQCPHLIAAHQLKGHFLPGVSAQQDAMQE